MSRFGKMCLLNAPSVNLNVNVCVCACVCACVCVCVLAHVCLFVYACVCQRVRDWVSPVGRVISEGASNAKRGELMMLL